jgi:signal transduction histidine kinase
MLEQVQTEPDQYQDLPGPVDLHRQIRRIVATVVVASRLAALTMVAFSVAAAVQAHAYTLPALAGLVYLVLTGWCALFIALVLRCDPIPGWVLAADVAVTAVGVVALAWSARTRAFQIDVTNPDLEPVTVAVAVAVALISRPAWHAVACSTVLGVAYSVAQVSTVPGAPDVISIISVVGWQAGTGACCYVFIRRLRAMAHTVNAATAEVVAARERVAARRVYTEQRMRHFREQIRRYRALHDGPLRILTAIAGPGPAGHPDPEVRRQCAVSVNLLRGASPDEPGGTLTDLSLALIEAGNESAAYGLRVEYHFANLPDDLPADVVQALSRASAEALSNVVAHAGTSRVRLTALVAGDPQRPAVVVAIVDQGRGFDPEATGSGYGIRHSILGRMAEIGGVATVDSHPGQGTRIDLRWPR